MASKTTDEVKKSVMELTRIYRPENPRKFVKDFVKKYKIHGGYENELTHLVEMELGKLK